MKIPMIPINDKNTGTADTSDLFPIFIIKENTKC